MEEPKRPRDTAAIFARIPRAQAEKLERLSFELKRPKQEIIAGLLAEYAHGQAAESESWALGRYAFRPTEAPEVMTLEQAAQFLQVDEETMRGLAQTGEVPGRRVGDEWRFSRQAILAWLEGGQT